MSTATSAGRPTAWSTRVRSSGGACSSTWPGPRALEHLPDRYEITPADVAGSAAAHRARELRPGDSVLVRTGWYEGLVRVGRGYLLRQPAGRGAGRVAVALRPWHGAAGHRHVGHGGHPHAGPGAHDPRRDAGRARGAPHRDHGPRERGRRAAATSSSSSACHCASPAPPARGSAPSRSSEADRGPAIRTCATRSCSITGAAHGLGAATRPGVRGAGLPPGPGRHRCASALTTGRWLDPGASEDRLLSEVVDLADAEAYEPLVERVAATLRQPRRAGQQRRHPQAHPARGGQPVGLRAGTCASTWWRPTSSLAPPSLQMRAAGRGGRIVNVASMAGRTGGVADIHPYAASKGGLLAITKSLAKAVAADGILVNAILPSNIESPMLRESFPPEAIARTLGQVPLGRTAEPRRGRGAGAVALQRCRLLRDRRQLGHQRRLVHVLSAVQRSNSSIGRPAAAQSRNDASPAPGGTFQRLPAVMPPST